MAPTSAKAAAPQRGAGADGVVDDFGVAAVGADSPFLEEGLVGGADLEGVDDVAVTSGVEAVARGEFLDGEGAGSLVFVAFDVVVAVGVEAPHGDFEGGGVVDEGVVGQQAESFEARQRVVVAVVGEEAGYRAALAAQVAEQFVFELGAVFVFEVGDGAVESVSAVGEFALVGFPDFDCLFDGEFDAGPAWSRSSAWVSSVMVSPNSCRKVSMWTGSVVDASMTRRRMPSGSRPRLTTSPIFRVMPSPPMVKSATRSNR